MPADRQEFDAYSLFNEESERNARMKLESKMATHNERVMSEVSAAEAAAVDTLLADLDMDLASDDAEIDAVIEEIEAQDAGSDELVDLDDLVEDTPVAAAAPVEVDDDEIEAEMELVEARAEVYAEATSGVDLDLTAGTPEDAPAPSAASPAPRKTPSAGGRKKTSAASLDPEFFVLSIAERPADLEANKQTVIDACPRQKKVIEKFENLFTQIAAGATPSAYTMAAFRHLSLKGEMSNSSLSGYLVECGYSIGTARSQAGQALALFPKVGITIKDGGVQRLNPDSSLAAVLKELLTA